MRPWSVLGQAGGMAALAAMLLLSGPGVRVVRADESAGGPVPAPVCQASEELDPSALRDALARLAQEPPRGEAPEIIVLDNGGYNYGAPSGGELDALVGDLMRVQAEQ